MSYAGAPNKSLHRSRKGRRKHTLVRRVAIALTAEIFRHARDWRSSWDAIDEFIRAWLPVDFDRYAEEAQVTDMERDAGVALPASAREWCAFALASEQIDAFFTFRDCLAVEPLKAHDAISLLLQGESDQFGRSRHVFWTSTIRP